MTTILKPSEDLLLTLPPEVVESLQLKPGQKLHMKVEGETLILSKYESVEIELEDDIFAQLALLAHEQDITFNQFIQKLLIEKLNSQTA